MWQGTSAEGLLWVGASSAQEIWLLGVGNGWIADWQHTHTVGHASTVPNQMDVTSNVA